MMRYSLFGLALAACSLVGALPAVAGNVSAYCRKVDGTFASGNEIVNPVVKQNLSAGSSCTFTATAPDGTRAGEWWVYDKSPLGATGYDAKPKYPVGEGSSCTYTFVDEDVSGADVPLVLHLVKTYKVTATVSPATGGTVTISGTNGVGTVDAGGSVTLTAKAKAGYTFDHWERGETKAGDQNEIEFSFVNADIACTAVFKEKQLKYTLTVNMESGVRYEGFASPYTLPTTLIYDATNLNELAVLEKKGCVFQGYFLSNGTQLYDGNGHNIADVAGYWSEAYPNGVYRHQGNLTVEARFSEPVEMHDVAVDVSPATAGTVAGGGKHEKGSQVELTATPNAGYSFAHWLKGGQVLTDNPLTFTLTADVAYMAVFTGNVYKVTLKETQTMPTPTMYVTYGSAYGEFPQFSYQGYKLDGWWTSDDEETRERVDEHTIVTTAKNHNLYANWVEKTEFTVIWRDPQEDPNKKNDDIVQPNVAIDASIGVAPEATKTWDVKWQHEAWIAGWNPPLPQIVTDDLTFTAVVETIGKVLDWPEQRFQRNDNWQVETNEWHNGNSCLKLGLEGTDGKANTITTELKVDEDGGLLSFWWKSASGTKLQVSIGNTPTEFSATSNTWCQQTVEVPAGSQTVSMTYVKQAFEAPLLIDDFTWDPNGKAKRTIQIESDGHGTVTPATGDHDVGSPVTLTATEYDGYAFCCWTNETGVVTNANPWTFTVEEDVSYTATFTNAQYVVTLDPNGGTGGDASVIVTYDKPLPGLASTPTRTDGWTFNGYTNAAGVAYYDADGEGLKAWDQPNAATLFAQWKAPDEYALTVTVEGRGSVIKNPDASQYVANTTVSLETKPDVGASFAQWDDGEKSPTRTVTMTGDITLTATFTNCQYVVTFDANGGSVTQKTTIVTYSKAYGTLPPPSSAPAGFEFVGWYTAATGGTKVESTTNVTTAADHTLYAHWDADVGDLSKALDCNNLRFKQTGGWEIGSDPTLGALNGTYVYTSTKDAILKATIEKSGILTFHYKGYASNLMTVQVLLGDGEVSDARINIKNQESYLDTWQSVDVPIQVTGDSVMLTFKCTKVDPDGCCCTLDHVTWMPDAPEHPEPTDADKVTITSAGVADGKFTLSFTSDERFDYNLLTNANLLINSWGTMEKKVGTGKTLTFEPEIIDGLPQLFYKVETIQKEDCRE